MVSKYYSTDFINCKGISVSYWWRKLQTYQCICMWLHTITTNIVSNWHQASVQCSSVQSLSHVWLFATPWTAALQASLSITNSQTPPKPMSIESVMPSNHLVLCHPLLLLPSTFPRIRVSSNESALRIRGPSIRVSASASVPPVNTQD